MKLLSNIDKNLLCGICGDSEINYANYNFPKKLIKLKISLQKKDEKPLANLINESNPNLILSIQYPWIISSKIIKRMKNQIYNLHNAKLPEYRGHNTISYEIINKKKYHYSTIHKINSEIDLGEIVYEDKILIRKNWTAFDLWKNSHKTCINIFKKFIDSIKSEKIFQK